MKFKTFFRNWMFHLIVSFLLIALAEFIFWFILTKTGYMDVVNTYVRDCDFSLYDAFYTQCSLTFIVVSLISFLSNNTNDVLWDDTIAYSLKKPFHTNFVALSAFLVSDLIISIILFIIKAAEVLYLATLLVCVILLIFVLYKIMGAYFMKNGIRKKLISEFEEAEQAEKKEDLNILYQKTLQELDGKKYTEIYENIDFLRGCQKSDGMDDAGIILYSILEYMSTNSPAFFITVVQKYGMGDDKRIMMLMKDLCIVLIGSNELSNLKKTILLMLYKNVPEFAMPDVGIYSIDSTTSLEFNNNDINQLVEESNTKIESKINEMDKPVDLLYVAFNARDIETFEEILTFLEKEKDEVQKKVDDTISNIHQYGNSDNVDRLFEYFWKLKPSFFSISEKERLSMILEMDDSARFLLKNQKNRIALLVDSNV